jgi:hypothetical protein
LNELSVAPDAVCNCKPSEPTFSELAAGSGPLSLLLEPQAAAAPMTPNITTPEKPRLITALRNAIDAPASRPRAARWEPHENCAVRTTMRLRIVVRSPDFENHSSDFDSRRGRENVTETLRSGR